LSHVSHDSHQSSDEFRKFDFSYSSALSTNPFNNSQLARDLVGGIVFVSDSLPRIDRHSLQVVQYVSSDFLQITRKCLPKKGNMIKVTQADKNK
jgi:hypothetical protein